MRLRGNESLAIHAYRLILEQAERSLHYATIIEVHHPDYLAEPELRQLYSWNDENRLANSDIDELISRVWG